MSSNTTMSNAVRVQEKQETSLVKYKLYISLTFLTMPLKQQIKAQAYRQGSHLQKRLVENDIAEDLFGGTIRYDNAGDEGDGEYIIKNISYIVYENSPKAMNQASLALSRCVEGYCKLPNVSEVIPYIVIPSFNSETYIPKLFFEFFSPKCLLQNSRKQFQNLSINSGGIFFAGIAEAVSYVEDAIHAEVGGKNKRKVNQTLLQIFVLLSYYVYFYLDIKEQKDWSFFKKNICDKDTIQKFVNKQVKEKDNWVKKTSQFLMGCLLPIKPLRKAFDFLFNYDGHLKNRIYTRILDVLIIMGDEIKPNESDKKKDHNKVSYSEATEKIYSILKKCSNNEIINVESFFDECGYWKYYDNVELQKECKKWVVHKTDMGYLSGYGAILFTDGKDYIYAFKGTDFDSYGRDWLLTNAIQGLTGVSAQYNIAIDNAKKIDREIAGSDASLWFTGHSLGGGLASSATIATQFRNGYTFNAAGLNVIGTTLNKLINNPQGLFKPSSCWNRVYPYRIRGEILDNAQKVVSSHYAKIGLGLFGLSNPIGWLISPVLLLKRAYGLNSVEIDIDSKVDSCCKKHGINNFLFKEVMDNLKPFELIPDYLVCKGSADNNKVIKAHFYGKECDFMFDSNFQLC